LRLLFVAAKNSGTSRPWPTAVDAATATMSLDVLTLDVQIERLREGNTLSEHEVNALCDKVSSKEPDVVAARAPTCSQRVCSCVVRALCERSSTNADRCVCELPLLSHYGEPLPLV
jgi:hypothetical protein